MFQLLKFILISNIATAGAIVLIDYTTGLFGIRFVSDYAFFTALILWGISALLYMYPPAAGFGSSSNKAERVADAMVDRSKSDKVDTLREEENSQMFTKLFIAGIPPMALCLLATYL